MLIELIEWCLAPFSKVFQSVISRRQLTLFMCITSTRRGLEVSCPRTLPRQIQMIQCSSNAIPVLRVNHSSTELRRTPVKYMYISLIHLKKRKENHKYSYNYESNKIHFVWQTHESWHLPFLKQGFVLTCVQQKSLENTVGKGEIARYEQFLLFPQCFLLFGEISTFFIKSKIIVCKLFQFGRVIIIIIINSLFSEGKPLILHINVKMIH